VKRDAYVYRLYIQMGEHSPLNVVYAIVGVLEV
jgi:hypothetical protein